ncbi:protein phosphatase 2C domain-containing protein [Streptomyces sp. NPDC002580]|uniref:protein phosphatase 2C domain-containing protein n=1 Tax=Streptomyces sp. NPDC002580 TaxID=3364653 RepID=UPI0036B4C087
MRTELVSEPGDPGRPNEDFASVGLPASGQGGSLVVLDGVTPPRGDYGCSHPVPWFSARLGGALTELSVSQEDLPLREVLSRAIARVAEAHAATCDLSHPRTPQATVVLARWTASEVEYLVLSDSALLVESPTGEVTALLDDRLSRLPRGALATDAVADATVRNKEGGFFTAAADPSAAFRAVTGTIPRASVRSLAALTDGATRWVEKFRMGDWAELFALVRDDGAAALVERVRALERADARERLWLGRSKTHDDATVVLVELRETRPRQNPHPSSTHDDAPVAPSES